MLAVVAEGRNPARGDTAIDAASRGKPVVCKLNPDRIEELVHAALPEETDGPHMSHFTQVMRRSLDTVNMLSQEVIRPGNDSAENVAITHPALKYCRAKPDTPNEDASSAVQATTEASVEVYRQGWQHAYDDWRQSLLLAEKKRQTQNNGNSWTSSISVAFMSIVKK